MGLDNIPHNYACVLEKTAVLVGDNDLISCKLTQEANGCPWKRESDKLTIPVRVTTGMLGTDCWFRGKYANALVEDFASVIGENPPHSFYGYEQDDGTEGLSPSQCEELSEWMNEMSDEFRYCSYGLFKDEDDNRVYAIQSWDYIAWWLQYSADFSDGIDAWY